MFAFLYSSNCFAPPQTNTTDLLNGPRLWQWESSLAVYFSPAWQSPATDGTSVVVADINATLRSHDAFSGAVNWAVQGGGGSSFFAYSRLVSPDCRKDCFAFMKTGSTLSALDSSGAVAWTGVEVPDDLFHLETEDVAVAEEAGVLLSSSREGLLSWMRLHDGHILGRYQLPPGFVLQPPATDGVNFYVSSLQGGVYAVPCEFPGETKIQLVDTQQQQQQHFKREREDRHHASWTYTGLQQ